MNWTNIPYCKKLIRLQCRIAGVNFKKINFDKDQWYNSITWSEIEESRFKKVAIRLLKSNINMRKELMNFPNIKTNKVLNDWFTWWNLAYGFKRIDYK